MKHILLISWLFLIIISSGCKVLINPDRRVPDEYEMWSKTGASQLQIKKIILECGFVSIYDLGITNMSLNNIILSHLCVKNRGYVYVGRDPCFGFNNNKKPPACLLDAVIPEPSVERRLNSRYCKSERAHNRPECQP
jgi:hypothetical protein